MSTVQVLLDRARFPLNDAAKVRYPDSELLVYCRECLHLVKRKRPDLFVGRWAVSLDVAVGDDVPVPAAYTQAVADYVTGRAESKDGDMGTESRAMLFMQLGQASL